MLQRRATVSATRTGEGTPSTAVIPVPLDGLTLEGAERQLLELTLRLTNNNQTRAARMLGISRPTIIRKIRKYALDA